jgi:hypothetical protein
MIGSDGLPHESHPHPRLWGTFPRVLGHYSRELGLFSLETAVHKMSGLSARNFKLEVLASNQANIPYAVALVAYCPCPSFRSVRESRASDRQDPST